MHKNEENEKHLQKERENEIVTNFLNFLKIQKFVTNVNWLGFIYLLKF